LWKLHKIEFTLVAFYTEKMTKTRYGISTYERRRKGGLETDHECEMRLLSSTTPGGDCGGTANSWNTEDSRSKTFLAVACDSLVLPTFLDGRDKEATALVELLLSIECKNFSLESDGADAMTELNTPDSLKLCIMTCRQIHWEMNLKLRKNK